MNVNLDRHYIKSFKFGRMIDQLYKFEVRWYQPDSINQPYKVDDEEVKRMVQAIEENRRTDPVVILKELGIVSGMTQLEAFRKLKFDKIPILYGRLK